MTRVIVIALALFVLRPREDEVGPGGFHSSRDACSIQWGIYRSTTSQILTSLARYINDAPALTRQQVQRRGDRILARIQAAGAASPLLTGKAIVQGHTRDAVIATKKAVRDWYRFRDPDLSNTWSFHASQSLSRARTALNRVACAARTPTPTTMSGYSAALFPVALSAAANATGRCSSKSSSSNNERYSLRSNG